MLVQLYTMHGSLFISFTSLSISVTIIMIETCHQVLYSVSYWFISSISTLYTTCTVSTLLYIHNIMCACMHECIYILYTVYHAVIDIYIYPGQVCIDHYHVHCTYNNYNYIVRSGYHHCRYIYIRGLPFLKTLKLYMAS